MDYAEAARRIMKVKGVTREALAKRMGVSMSAVNSSIGNEHKNISYNKLLRMCDALGYSLIMRDREFGFEVVLTPSVEEEFWEARRRREYGERKE